MNQPGKTRSPARSRRKPLVASSSAVASSAAELAPEVIDSDPSDAETRRDEIIRAAAELFVTKGYAQTSMGDVGKVVGMSGPALYHYFSGKTEILVSAVLHADQRLREALKEAVGRAPGDALDALIRSYVQVTVEEPVFIAIWLRDRPHYEAIVGSSQSREHQRLYIEEWVMTLGRVRPELSSADARVLVQAALGAVNSIVLYRPGVESRHFEEVLVTVASAVLAVPVPDEG